MTMTQGTLETAQGNWPYIRYGRGKSLWLAFPGFGQSPDFVEPLLRGRESQFRCISLGYPDLPPGASPENIDPLSPCGLEELWDKVRQMEGGQSAGLLGYSLGARLAMKLFELRHEEVDQAFLLVPDGAYIRPLYRFCTGHPLGRAVFLWAIRHPQGLGAWMDWGGRTGLITPPLIRFARHFWDDPGHRKRLAWIWLFLRGIHPDWGRIRKKQRTKTKPITLVLGKEDPLISARKWIRLADTLEGARVHVLDRGHFVLDPVSLKRIKKWML